MITKKRLRTALSPVIKLIKFRVLHVDDRPHRIALGVALGFFAAYLPPLGYHIILLFLMTMIFKANKFVAFTCVWISNPLTFIPIYYPNYLLGKAVLSYFRMETRLGSEEVAQLFRNHLSPSHIITGIGDAQFWQQLWTLFMQIGLEMFLGGIIIGTAIATAAYLATYHTIMWYRKKHPHRFHLPD